MSSKTIRNGYFEVVPGGRTLLSTISKEEWYARFGEDYPHVGGWLSIALGILCVVLAIGSVTIGIWAGSK